MAKERTMMLMGAPRSGKTSYIALAMSYLQQRSGGAYAVTPENDKDHTYTARIAHDMKQGRWPEPTQNTELWNVVISHNYQIPAMGPPAPKQKAPIDWSRSWKFWKGEVEDCIRFYDCMGEDFLAEDGNDEVLERCRKADYFLLFVDAESLGEDDEGVRGVLQRCSHLLQQRNRDKTSRKCYVAIIFTKCDLLRDVDAFAVQVAPGWDEGKIVEAFERRYKLDIPWITFDRKKLIYRYFCVSCIPDRSHVRHDRTLGAVATEDWSPYDMEGQIEPIRWISTHFH